MKKIILAFIATLAFTSITPLLAQDFDKGFAAYKIGDYAAALKEWKPLAEQGHAQAQHNMGVMYDKSRGVAQDYTEAEKWYRRAAEQGVARAQHNLGWVYDNGEGVAQDYIRSHIWYNIAAANGIEKAGERRDKVAAKMTSEDISKAQSMVIECMESNYKNCGF